MLKRLAFTLLLLPAVCLGLLWQLAGISPAQIPSAVALATGLGAKLACSGQYVSAFDAQRNEQDLAVYSGLTRLLSFRALEEQGVAASFLGSTAAIARYRPGLGCTLEYGTPSRLDGLELRAPVINITDPWPKGALEEPVNTHMAEVLQGILAADNAAGLDTRALLVVRRGRVLGEAYDSGIDRNTPLLGWSMGKSVTAIMLGRLEALGKVSVKERGVFPAWAVDERRAISLENLLQMSSGLDFDEDYMPGSDATRMLFMSPSASEVAMASSVVHAPGTYFSYSSGTTNLLARLMVERAGGTPQAGLDFINEEIGAPLGLQATTMELDASGVFVGSSFMYAPARDWARFGYLMVNAGQINGQRIVEEEWIARATSPNSSDNEPRYGYQFWLNDGGKQLRWPSLPETAYAMLGNRGQVVMMLPSLQTVIVRLGWSATDYPVDRNVARVVAALVPGLATGDTPGHVIAQWP